MEFIKITEQDSLYDNLEHMSTNSLLQNINNEDQKVALAVEKSIPQIEKLVNITTQKLKNGGRLFYLGAGTSGRLGVLDASECPPTFGVDYNTVIGLIAGGDKAIRKAVENAEDDNEQGWLDLQKFNISSNDVVVGIAASGTTPYVLGALKACNDNNVTTGCITMNIDSPLDKIAKYSVVVTVGPEFLTGSSRMKAGTAQKMVLNMVSTSVMVLLGKVKGNKMVDMQLSNSKLVDRGAKMILKEINVEYSTAKSLLLTHGSVRDAIKQYNNGKK